jgi:uncharacterized protein YecT (DUF1311 family)
MIRTALALLLVFGLSGGIGAATAEEGKPPCATTEVDFAFRDALQQASVVGPAGTHIRLLRKHPAESSDTGAAYLIPGDQVEVALVCAGYAHVRYHGKSTVASGWVASSSLGPAAAAQNTPCDANQLSLNECAERDFKAAEANMTQVLTTLLERLKGTESAALLRESQNSWLQFRDADCRYYVSGLSPGGSMLGEWQNECRTSRTQDRTKQLEQMRQCESNGCPGQ